MASENRVDGFADDIWKVRFQDINEIDIYEYNPRACISDGTRYEVQEDEELIGVYGVVDKTVGKLTSLGFIVKIIN